MCCRLALCRLMNRSRICGSAMTSDGVGKFDPLGLFG